MAICKELLCRSQIREMRTIFINFKTFFMKRVLVLLGALLLLCSTVLSFIRVNSDLFNYDVEALSAYECLTAPGSNIGTCETATGGLGNVCVKSTALWPKNCYGQINL